VGGLIVANRGKPNIHRLTGVGIAFSVMIAAVALSPTLVAACVALVFMGGFSIAFIATANSTIQLQVEPTMRGRVMALYAMGFLVPPRSAHPWWVGSARPRAPAWRSWSVRAPRWWLRR